MQASVHYIAGASFVIDVEIPDDTPEDERVEAAREAADNAFPKKHPGSLCHQCASHYDLGDFEQDPDDDGVTIYTD